MTKRIGLVIVVILIFTLFVVSKLFYWQVVRHADILALSYQQNSESFTVPSTRGSIMTSDKFPLATNTITYMLYANPKVVADRDEYANKISKILNLESASISSKLKYDSYFAKITSGLSLSQKKQISDLKLKGLDFQTESSRIYPEGSLAAQLIGFVGKDAKGNPKGYFGVEGYYDAQLAGRDGALHVIHDAFGNAILSDIRQEKKIDGRTLALTVDRTIQYIAEKKLKEGIDTYGAEGGSVILMEPATGKILGMASFPEFNPHSYFEFDSSTYKNPIITNVYEPGSTFKVLVMAAGIDAGMVSPDTRCAICAGPVQIGEYSIRTWNNEYEAGSTMTDVIIHSDNTGMVFVAQKLGLSKFISYIRKFGIGELTNIDLQGEISGIMKEDTTWSSIDLATASFGQGISVTPLQLLTAVNSIANGGTVVTPYVVSKITTDEKKEINIKPKIKRRVISDSTAKIMKEMMVAAVEKGEAKWTKLKDYKVAGKTGTAQIPVAGHYDPNQTIASFVGFFPADNPKVSMLVVIDRPKKSIYGAETAAPIFFQIAKEIINYYGIQPDN